MDEEKQRRLLLQVKNLKTHFFTDEGVARAVDGMDFEIYKGETLGIIGESGCGKSVSALSILQLIAIPPGKIIEGEIIFDGEDLLKKSHSEIRKIRGNSISMIFQEPMTSLNPVYTIGNQIMETILFHQHVTKGEAHEKAVEMLRLVGISDPDKRVREYPHQLSGGMRQRAMIAMALACNPKLLIADEPTTALDVTVQAQMLTLIKQRQEALGMAMVLITHDLGVIAGACDRVLVMYAGRILESGTVRDVFYTPRHPYTRALMEALPSVHEAGEPLHTISGMPPDPTDIIEGCPFASRCKHVLSICRTDLCRLDEVAPGHATACVRAKVDTL